MKKTISIMLVSLFLISMASAYYSLYQENPSKVHYSPEYSYKEKVTETAYYPKYNEVIATTKYRDYDNDKRFSTYDYRHGYSYRSTKNYFDDYVKNRAPRYVNQDHDNYRSDMYRSSGNSDSYYRYIPYLKKHEKVKCYNSPPKGKLFYIKCP